MPDPQKYVSLAQLGYQPPPPPTQPVIRAPTWTERLSTLGQDLYEGLANTLPGQFSDAFGLTGFAGIAQEMARPQEGVQMSVVPPMGAGRLYSRVEQAAAAIPAKGVHPNKALSLLKSGASAEELAYRNVPEFLASKGNSLVTPQEMAAHLAEHPAPMPAVKTLRGQPGSLALQRRAEGFLGRPANTPDDYVRLSRQMEREAQQLQSRHQDEMAQQYFALAEEATAMSEGLANSSTAGQPKYAQYQLPGGENYRETLLTLPSQPHNTYDGFVTQMERKYGAGYDTARLTPAEQSTQGRLWAEAQRPGGMTDQTFRGSHFSDTPNILAHTRSNERTLPTGERGHFIEEVQSDWHQTGKMKGYKIPELTPADVELKRVGGPDGYWETYDRRTGQMIVRGPGSMTPEQAVNDAIGFGPRGNDSAVPDAPFKDNWPDLALKQHLLDAAADPKAEWLGVSSADTQIQRWGSERVQWKPNQNQSDMLGRPAWEVTFESQVGGDALAGQGIHDMGAEATARGHIKPETKLVTTEAQLADVIGDKTKAAKAWKRMQAAPDGGNYLPRAEGFRQQYDQNLKNKLQAIAKSFGGTVEPAPVVRPKGEINRDIDAVLARDAEHMTPTESTRYQALQRERNIAKDQPVVSWIVRLTPEMKAKILKAGLPLMAIPFAVGHERQSKLSTLAP